MFPNIPDDLLGIPLKLIYDICSEKFGDEPQTLKINTSKYIGMLVREAVYYSDVEYCEQMMGSVRKYSLARKQLSENDYHKNRAKVIELANSKKI